MEDPSFVPVTSDTDTGAPGNRAYKTRNSYKDLPLAEFREKVRARELNKEARICVPNVSAGPALRQPNKHEVYSSSEESDDEDLSDDEALVSHFERDEKSRSKKNNAPRKAVHTDQPATKKQRVAIEPAADKIVVGVREMTVEQRLDAIASGEKSTTARSPSPAQSECLFPQGPSTSTEQTGDTKGTPETTP